MMRLVAKIVLLTCGTVGGAWTGFFLLPALVAVPLSLALTALNLILTVRWAIAYGRNTSGPEDTDGDDQSTDEEILIDICDDLADWLILWQSNPGDRRSLPAAPPRQLRESTPDSPATASQTGPQSYLPGLLAS